MTRTIPATPSEYDQTRIFERPDGFYWQSKTEGRESGPFPTLIEAIQDMQYRDESEVEPGETIEEAEAEVGVTGWVDPETGEPAEEGIPRLEQH
jgi:hypothetical protein